MPDTNEHTSSNFADRPEAFLERRVIIKFDDDIGLPYEDNIGELLPMVGPWEEFIENFGDLTVNRVFTSLTTNQLENLMNLGRERDPAYGEIGPNFLTFFVVIVPEEVDPFAVAKELSAWDAVDYAYVESLPAPPPAVPVHATAFTATQLYLGPPQVGIAGAPHMGGVDVQGVWGMTGSSGEGVTFVDIERGWDRDHEDLLNPAGAPIIPLVLDGVNNDEIAHGTCVLGILAAQDNPVGCVGIARLATGHIVSPWQSPALTSADFNIPNAITYATDFVASAGNIGHVLLLELQLLRTEAHSPADSTLFDKLLPVESEPANYEAIRLAVAVGVVVIEAAGNGEKDAVLPESAPTSGIFLDDVADTAGAFIFSPGHADQRDSGAIMVAAADPMGNDAQREGLSNFGQRVDCYAWGNSVTAPTLAGDPDYDPNGDGYTISFDGTSSAAAIVAGAAIVMQGLALEHRGDRFMPFQLRQIIKDTGTPSGIPNQGIGVMPDLGEYATSILGFVGDVFVRDFVGDDGSAHMGSISNSPDIIVRPAMGLLSVGDGQAAFGPGSNTEEIVPAGSSVFAGNAHRVYVRARVRNGPTAQNVHAHVYYAPPSSLLSPEDWDEVGETLTGTNVSAATTITVLAPIDWPAGNIPPLDPDPNLNHYCFVGTIGNNEDPNPVPDHTALPDLTWDQFRMLIRNNNNITWRNFNVVPMPMAAAGGLLRMLFFVRGAWDEVRPLDLEIIPQLPAGFQLSLTVQDEYLKEALSEAPGFVEDDGRLKIALDPGRATRFAAIQFPLKFKAAVNIQVEVPPGQWPDDALVIARQLYRGEEAGRITWLLKANMS